MSDLLTRKMKLNSQYRVKAVVEEDGDHYLIDILPCFPGPILRVPKEYVTVSSTSDDVTCPDESVHKMHEVSIRKGAPTIRMEPFELNDTNWASFADLRCMAVIATNPLWYGQARAIVRILRERGIAKNEGECKSIVKDVERMTALGFGDVVAWITGEFGECACKAEDWNPKPPSPPPPDHGCLPSRKPGPDFDQFI